ncbi:MAG: AMP-binding protein, partial [bacterium]|nr:AMP-binding protein [bacterium]
TAVYNIPHTFRLSGEVSAAVLARIFNEVVRRHEALRTTFAVVEGRPHQAIAAELELTLPVVDLGRLPERQQETEARRRATEEARRPFDLARGPLLRVTLLRLTTSHVVLVTLHHIVSDFWSFGVLLNEVAVLHGAFSRGEGSPLPELPVQYADYAHWQRRWLTAEVLDAELGYWREQLAGAPQLPELPTDRPRPAMQTFNGRFLPVSLSNDLAGGLTALAQGQGATRFMMLVAAFKVLLSRWSAQTDVVVGSPIAGRTRKEIEGLIGFFVNTLVLRTDLSGNPTFQELLGRIRQVALDAYAHQNLPFERLVEELAPQRDLGSNPLFQVMFVLQNTRQQESVEIPELSLTPMSAEAGMAKFDLTLVLTDDWRGGVLEYNTDLYDATTMQRLLAHFDRLLREVAEDPEQRLAELVLLSAAERHQLLAGWNDTGAPWPRVDVVVELFTAQATRTPERVALVFGAEQVSYRELERRSNRVAHYLRDRYAGPLGAGPEVPVGMAIERSVDLVVAMFGIFKSGGFLVPLDRSLPAERLAFIIEDA